MPDDERNNANTTKPFNPDAEPATSQPVSSSSKPADQQPVATTTKRRPGKKRLAIIVASVLVVLGLSGSVAAYNLWYQNPDKVLIDSVINIAKADNVMAEGTMNLQNDDIAITVKPTFNSKRDNGVLKSTITLKSKKDENKALDGITLDGNVMYEKNGTFYFKLDRISQAYEKVIDSYIDTQVQQYQSLRSGSLSAKQRTAIKSRVDAIYKPIVTKLDGQWVKVDSNKESTSSKRQKCLAKAYEMFEDRAVVNEVADTYKANTFISVKERLGSKDGNLGYKLGYDTNKAKSFTKDLRSTKIGKEFLKCDKDSLDTKDAEVSGDKTTTTFEVWISRWSHELAKVKFDIDKQGKDKVSLTGDINTVFNQKVTVEAPKNAKTLDEIFGEGGLFGAILGASVSRSSSSTEI